MVKAWWQGTGRELAAAAPTKVLGDLAHRLPFSMEPAQKAAWNYEIGHLAELGLAIPDSHIFLEFAIPRMGRRADAVVAAGGMLFVLEYKVGAKDFPRYAVEQVHGYALDLKSFHETSHDKRLVPISTFDPALHLAVSQRSFRAETVSAWVSALLGPDAALAKTLVPAASRFPIVRTRSLAQARAWLRGQRRAGERAGLLASSNGIRLKPEGLHVKAKVDVANWFLGEGDDIRASNSLEDAATEFDVQGLELDWAGVCWDLNLLRGADGWLPRRFRGTAWESVNDADKRGYVVNSYRVLLTRARQGMVIFVPPGDPLDRTRPPEAYDAIDAWLEECGVPALG